MTEGISDVALITDADWHMVSHTTISIDTTEARAWVLALSVDTGKCGGAVRIDNTFWSACYVGISKVVGDALAGGSSASLLANCIGSTWRGVAWVYDLSRDRH